MPECVICNSQTFDVMDGMYFCTQCGTQSQDVREEVHEVDRNEPIDGKLSLKKTNKRQRKVFDCGKPWFTLEGFQVVLKAQIEFLMKIGVDPAIKNIIGQMWFTFVEKSTNAFGTRQNQNFSGVTRARDFISEDFIPTDSIPRKTPKCFGGESNIDDDALELSSEIAREDFYEDDDPTGGLFEDVDEIENIDAGSHVGSVDVHRTTVQRSRKKYYDVRFMTMQHTVAFCFLSLLWIKEPICLADLIRWAVEGHFPYFDATKHFPSHMKLSQSDIMMFTRSTVPNKNNITLLARRVKTFIDLPDIPKHEINIYIARFAIDLQLPACIHRYISSVVEIIDLNFESLSGLLNYDDLAMAYIIISLRLIYGLDDFTEHELSKLTTDVEEDGKTYFPTWDDVIETIHTSHSLRLERGVPWSKEDLGKLKDCRNYSKFCKEKLFGAWKPESTVHRYQRQVKGVKGLNVKKQEEYASTFSLFLKTDENDEISERESVNSFPFLSAKMYKNNREASMESTIEDSTRPKGIRSDILSDYYKRRSETIQQESSNEVHKNRYILYDFPVTIDRQWEISRTRWWNDAVLSKSLRQLVELCSKMIYCEPTLLFNDIRMLETKMFKEIGE
ncbi:TATA box-binding protein-associated factor RNA polymerase I subunit B-like [Dendronephthya gigantea]|uniref:TATA box-binding protein-associated factor RNA polymerase I subunit B-like n=1 Tax=Dendronephthya gigantea TaxID=151771 RepID=UPI00106B8EE4|nr:TATA box-binding protein-associated factor RNA polymerase I subunit B-like [Dendronephthya gigantea]